MTKKKWYVYLSLGFGKVNNDFVLITGLKTKTFGGIAFRSMNVCLR